MNQKIQRFILLMVGILAMSFAIGYLVFAWVEPGANPPQENVPAPINVGDVEQYKAGRLGVYTNGVDTSYGLTVGSATTPRGIKATGSSYLEGPLQVTATTTLATAAGNVGIGTTSPANKLDVNGITRISNGYLLIAPSLQPYGLVVDNNAIIGGSLGVGGSIPIAGTALSVGGNTEVSGILKVSDYVLVLSSTKPYGLVVHNNAIIDGSLGLGGSIPIAGIPLSVGGDAQVSGILTADKIGVGTNPGSYRLNVNGPTYISGSLGLGTFSGFRLTLPNSAGMDGSGLAYEWVTYSSKRWKTNIKKIDNALDKVLELEGVEFDWKKEYGGKHDIGLIAEDVGKVVPEVIVYEDDSKENAVGLSYERLIPLLIEALKEQQKQINQLQSEINILKNTH
jgi:hypothetical protein